jgi:alginate O-acetyltransferase complex protein AlgI
MVYSNIEFFYLFLPTLFLFFMARNHNQRFAVLLTASLLFYGWAGVLDTLIFLMVIVVSWGATYLARKFPKRKRSFVAFGITVLALHLFVWKYAPWVVSNVQQIFPEFYNGDPLVLPLPVGISFFTLQGIAYMVDFARGKAEFISLKDYLLFKSFFAQLVAGPIVRVPQLLPQLKKIERTDLENVAHGIALFCMGWCKKVLIADRCASLVDAVFAHPGDFNRATLLFAVVGYTLQIWGDFSGYTDMGRGAARILGIRLPENFLSPYLSASPSEFWRRWHITLSQWIRDYIYIPLGGSHGSAVRVLVVAMVTMAISGLWHGANWTFVLWGLYHGVLLIGERVVKPLSEYFPKHGVGRWATWTGSVVLMQLLVAFGWILFRADGLGNLTDFLRAIAYPAATAGPLGSKNVLAALVLGMGLQIVFYADLKRKCLPFIDALRVPPRWKRSALAGALCGLLLAFSFLTGSFFRPSDSSSDFIYFRF